MQSREKRAERFLKTFKTLSIGKCFNQSGVGVAVVFQKLVRLRAANEFGICECISCGKHDHWKKMQGGHYISRSNKSTILHPDNVHPQCHQCNAPPSRGGLAGNGEGYHRALVEKIGEDGVSHLRQLSRESRQWSKHELADLKVEFMEEIDKHLKRLGEK